MCQQGCNVTCVCVEAQNNVTLKGYAEHVLESPCYGQKDSFYPPNCCITTNFTLTDGFLGEIVFSQFSLDPRDFLYISDGNTLKRSCTGAFCSTFTSTSSHISTLFSSSFCNNGYSGFTATVSTFKNPDSLTHLKVGIAAGIGVFLFLCLLLGFYLVARKKDNTQPHRLSKNRIIAGMGIAPDPVGRRPRRGGATIMINGEEQDLSSSFTSSTESESGYSSQTTMTISAECSSSNSPYLSHNRGSVTTDSGMPSSTSASMVMDSDSAYENNGGTNQTNPDSSDPEIFTIKL